MTTMFAIVALMLALIATMLTATMLIAWRDFGRPPHALTWAAANAISAAHWFLTLLLMVTTDAASAYLVSLPPTLVARSALFYVGFRQRSGRRVRPRQVAALWMGAMLVCALLAVAGRPVWAVMAADLASVAFLIAAAAAVGVAGQRRSAAEHAVAIAILIVAAGQLSVGLTDLLDLANGPMVRLYHAVIAVVVPTSVTAVGLLSVFLIAADLSTRMRRLAETDPLTGLLNRRGLEGAIGQPAGARGRRAGRGGAAVMADLDSFKLLNDRFGHDAGDAALRAFAALVIAALRPGDSAARTGGEEFALLLFGASMAEAIARIEALRAATEAIRLPGRPEVRISASFGIAAIPAGRSAAAAIERADAALLSAKDGGRNRIVRAGDA